VPKSPIGLKEGQPTKLTKPHRQAEDGTTVTVGEHVIQAVRAGNYIETAAASAGIDKSTLYEWLKRGAQVGTDVEEGRRTAPRKGSYEYELRKFSHAVAEAEAEWEVGANATLERLGRRRPVTETRETTETSPTGEVTTKVTTLRKTDEADSATIRWRLERKYPKRYGRSLVEVSGPDGGPISVDVKAEARAVLESMVERIAANTRPETPAEDAAP
jgi:hypothetical protein